MSSRVDSTKRCSKCGDKFPATPEFFHRDRGKSDGLYSSCKQCQNATNKEYRNSPAGIVSHLQSNNRYKKTTTGQYNDRKNILQRNYGITIEQYEKMQEQQGGVCAICGKAESSVHGGVVKRLSIDHDHVTGKIRGLLCDNCNKGLGFCFDNISILESMISYLRRNQ